MVRPFKIALLLALLVLPFGAGAQQRVLKLRYDYPFSSAEDPRLSAGGGEVLRQLDSLVPPRYAIDSVAIAGWASPESGVAFNDGLSLRRAALVRERLSSHSVLASVPVSVRGGGENWAPIVEWLGRCEDRTVAPWRDTMLHIIRVNSEPDRREWILRQLGGGQPWERVKAEAYPLSRFVEVEIWYTEFPVEEEEAPQPVFVGPVVVEEPPVEPVVEVVPVPEPVTVLETVVVRDWRWELHTNLLVPALNIGAGVTLGEKRRFSLAADWYFPWLWPSKKNRWCFEVLALGLEGRWWFRDGSDPLRRGTGPSIGLGVMAGYFDLERRYKGIQGEFLAPSLDFRWTFPINHRRWRLGIGVGAGYFRSRTRNYTVYSEYGDLYRDGEWSNIINYAGPVRADVTLTIPIWHDTRVVKEVQR